jgi:hypothetical protein
VELHGLKTVKPLTALMGSLQAILGRPAELVEHPAMGEATLLVLVGPVWASTICPPIRSFLTKLTDLDGRKVINLVVGYNTYESVVRKVNTLLRTAGAGPILSEAVRLRDADQPDKITSLAERLVECALT